MSKYWSDIVRAIKPYTPGEQPQDRTYIKLNTNENPYPPSPAVLAAIAAATDGRLRLYPDPTCAVLRTAIARRFGREPEEVFVGNGSDELLAFVFPAFFQGDRAILFPDVTYSFFSVYAALFRTAYRLVPLAEDFSVPIEALRQPNGGILLANPNAPTGRYLPLAEVRRILASNPDVVVVIDEAYVDFGGTSAASFIPEFPNLLIVQTFSKSRSLAGLRVGFALGQAELIEAIGRIKNSFNSYTLDRLALAGAVAAIDDEQYFTRTRAMIIATRERISPALADLGFTVLPSCANFIFISHPRCPAADLFLLLRERGILVRYFPLPRIDNYLRITIGTDTEMDALLTALNELL